MRALWTVIFLALLLAPARGQARRPIGADSQEKIDLPDGDEVDDEAKNKAKDEEAKRKIEAERQRKAEAEKAAILQEEHKRELAEKAAREAAEAAKKKKQVEAERARATAEKKKAEDASKQFRAALKAARKQRMLSRRFNALQIKIALVPGAPELKAVQEVQVDISEKLEIPDPRFGDRKPVTGARLQATVTLIEPADKPARKRSRRKAAAAPAEPQVYRLHPLEDAGVYGFHTTLLQAGHYQVNIQGTNSEGQAVEASFELYPGQWPPPDWDQENSKSQAAGGRRRPIGM